MKYLKTKNWQFKLIVLGILVYSSIMTPIDVASLIYYSTPILLFAVASFLAGSKNSNQKAYLNNSANNKGK